MAKQRAIRRAARNVSGQIKDLWLVRPPSLCKTALKADCCLHRLEPVLTVSGYSVPVQATSGSAVVLASCDSTSTPTADRSLSKRWVSWNPRAA